MKFKCKHTGQVYEFTLEHDIKSMLAHAEYEAVKEEEEKKPAPAKKQSKGD